MIFHNRVKLGELFFCALVIGNFFLEGWFTIFFGIYFDNNFDETGIIFQSSFLSLLIKSQELKRKLKVDFIEIHRVLFIKSWSCLEEGCNVRVLTLVQLYEFQQSVGQDDRCDDNAAECSQASFDALVAAKIESWDCVRKLIKVQHLAKDSVLLANALTASHVLHFL